MSTRYYLANCYPRINDESAGDYAARLERLAETNHFSPRCAVNLHTECGWCQASCHCLCHEETDPDEQLRGRVIELLQPITCDLSAEDSDLNETAQQIIDLVRSHK